VEGELDRLNRALSETGWDQLLTIEFKRLRDYGLARINLAVVPDDDVTEHFQRAQLGH
jgi:hypothetical protein